MVKRCGLFVFLACACAAAAGADGWERGRGPGWFRPKLNVEPVTVSGNLMLAGGMIALKDGDTTYYLRGLERLAGFIEGLKEGAKVTVEGQALSRKGDAAAKMVRPVKLRLDGKEYDLGAPADFAPAPPARRGRR